MRFLEAVRPLVAVTPVSAGNSFGQPVHHYLALRSGSAKPHQLARPDAPAPQTLRPGGGGPGCKMGSFLVGKKS